MHSKNLVTISRFIVFWLLTCLALDSTADMVEPSLREKIQQQFAISKEGVCNNQKMSIAISDVIRLKNKVVNDESKNRLIGIEGESVFLKRVSDDSKGGEEKTIFNLDATLSEKYNEEDIDVELELILLEKEGYAVLWRETYKHKKYRLGINVFKNDSLEYFCDGVGGISKSH